MASSNFPGIDYIHSALDWGGKKGFDLENVRKVAERLGNPQDAPKVVHIAGTNGKGSVSAAIASILGSTGATVGVNTSPHLASLSERIVIDGNPIDDFTLNEAALRVKGAAKGVGVVLSFHEVITIVAFECFKHLEWSVLEVGMGGRLDASNVVNSPAVTAIVSIDFDHERFLGNTLADIAKEKAGIVKRGAVLVTGRLPDEALSAVCEIAYSKGVKHVQFKQDYNLNINNINKLIGVDCEFRSSHYGNLSFVPSLRGEHQCYNMAVAVAIGKVLGIGDKQIKYGVENVFWPGRLEELEVNGKKILLDCAHNPAGIRSLVSYLKTSGLKDLTAGIGLLQRENWQQIIDELLPFINVWNVLTPNSDRALPAKEIVSYLASRGICAQCYDRDYQGFIADQLEKNSDERLLLTGSIYLIGDLRGMLIDKWRPIWERR